MKNINLKLLFRMKKYNFNAGPSILPREVIENTAKQILDFNGIGLSLAEISHRSKDFQPTLEWSIEFGCKVRDFAKQHGDNLYLMPIRGNLEAYLEGILG